MTSSDRDLTSSMARSGAAPYWVGLRIAADELPPGRERQELLKLCRDLKDGRLLATSAHSDSPLATILKAGRDSGRFAHVLGEYLQSSREVRSIWNSFWLQLAYPLVFLALAGIIGALFLKLVFDPMKSIFQDFGVELPGITVLMIHISNFLTDFWWVLLLTFLTASLAACFAYLGFGRSQFFGIIRWIPMIGSAFRNIAIAEFCSRLGVLTDARVPFPQAFEILSKTLTDSMLCQTSKRFSERIAAGMSLGEAADEEQSLPPAIVAILHWGDRPEALTMGLRDQNRVSHAVSRMSLAQLQIFMQPVLFTACGLLFGLLVIGMFMPLIKLLNDLS